MTRRADVLNGAIRRTLFYYLLFLILVVQALFVLVGVFRIDFDFDPALRVWVVTAVIPVSATAVAVWWDRRKLASYALEPWYLWGIWGPILFGFWAGGYFLVGWLTDPSRAAMLPPEWKRFDLFVPFAPSFVFLYVIVYPLFLLPIARARKAATLQRLLVGYVLMLTVSYLVFLITPVTYPRLHTMPPHTLSFASWTLHKVWGGDPPWNCLPSTHCAVAMLSALAIAETDKRLGVWAIVTALAIGVSTVYTKQHYIVDVIAGFSLAGATFGMLRWIWRNPEHVPERARELMARD